jgi:hypothetical protein
MAELSALQQGGIVAGILGFAISLVNAVQSWRKNRPIISIHKSHLPTDGYVEITIHNPSQHGIMITKWKSYTDADFHFTPDDANTKDVIRMAMGKEINWIIPGNTTHKYSLIRTSNSTFIMLISWQSNAAFIFAHFPLVVWMSKGRWRRFQGS